MTDRRPTIETLEDTESDPLIDRSDPKKEALQVDKLWMTRRFELTLVSPFKLIRPLTLVSPFRLIRPLTLVSPVMSTRPAIVIGPFTSTDPSKLVDPVTLNISSISTIPLMVVGPSTTRELFATRGPENTAFDA